MPIGGRKDTEKQKTTIASINNPKKEPIQWVISKPRYQLKDLILNQSTNQQIQDIISFFQNRELLFDTWGLKEKYRDRDGLSVNLYGEPGTGKTMAAHAISNALDKQMIAVNYAEIESKYVGETAKNLTDLFYTAMEKEAVIFFDEADALLSKRVTDMRSSTDVSVNETRSVLLTLLNDYRGVIIFATNFIKNYDVAFLRRIQFHVSFLLPDAEQREALWKMYIPEKMPCQVDYRDLAEKFDGISGSDISNAVFSAAVSAASNNDKIIDQTRFERAIKDAIKVKKANLGRNIKISSQILTEDEMREEFYKMDKQ